MSEEQEIEQKIQDKGLNAPRLTPELIDAAITGIQYAVFPGSQLTVCCITLRNGYTVSGESACVSPENFDQDIQQEISYHRARAKIQPLEEYILKDRLYKGPQPVPTTVLVKAFHQAFGHPAPDAIDIQDQKTRELRVSLIAEELLELCDGLALDVVISNVEGHKILITDDKLCDVDIVEVADALADLDYVVAGANVVFGLPAYDIISEVHSSNMSKLGEDGKPIYREDGKIMKGPNYRKPDIASILAD